MPTPGTARRGPVPRLANRGAAGLLKKGPTNGTAQPAVIPDHQRDRFSSELMPLVQPIASLKPDPMNARQHGEDNMLAIKQSLATFGQMTPIVANRRTRVVMKGNGTLQCLLEMGWTKIAVVMADHLSDAELMAYGLADNRTAEKASWDLKTVSRIERLLTLAKLPMVGWSEDEIIAVRIMAEQDGSRRSPERVPPPPAAAVSSYGDVWIMGQHRLACGDATDSALVQRLVGRHKGKLMVTDPPYGVDFEGAKYNPRAKAWAGIIGDKVQGVDLTKFITAVLGVWMPHMDQRAAYYLWAAAMQEGFALLQGMLAAGVHVQSQIIWSKNSLVLGQADYQWKHENCWYGFKKGTRHYWYGGRDQTTVWHVSKVPHAAYQHPMQKPTELYAIPIRNHTTEGQVVFEPFAGSGSQFIAAQDEGRVCYGTELDPVYCDVAMQRWMDYTALDAVRESDKASYATLRAEADRGATP